MDLRVLLLVGWSQLFLLLNLIAGFLENVYLCKESIGTYVWQLSFYIFFIYFFVFSIKLSGRPFSKNLISVVLFFLAFILLSLKNDLQVISTAVSLSSISCFVTTLVVEILQESLLHEKIVVKGRYHLRLLFWLQDFLIKNQESRIEKPIDVLIFYAWSCSVTKNLRLTFLVRFG